jgi:hypothetical protein
MKPFAIIACVIVAGLLVLPFLDAQQNRQFARIPHTYRVDREYRIGGKSHSETTITDNIHFTPSGTCYYTDKVTGQSVTTDDYTSITISK